VCSIGLTYLAHHTNMNNPLTDEQKLEAIRSVNGCLAMLAKDEDLQDDLQLPLVLLAISHWSGTNRLPPEQYSKKLERDLRVQSVYPKLKRLQAACAVARIGLPLDHFLQGKPELDSRVLTQAYGADFCIRHHLTRPPTPRPSVLAAAVDGDEDLSPLPPTPHNASAKESAVDHFLRTGKNPDGSDVPPAIDVWRVMKDSLRNADWWAIFVNVLQQQLLIFVATVALAFVLGFITVEDLLARFNAVKARFTA